MPDILAVAIGAFADPGFPVPGVSVYERRQHAWVETGLPLEHVELAAISRDDLAPRLHPPPSP